MLPVAAMNRVCLAAVLLAASSSVASAGIYAGLGIGTGADVNHDSGVNTLVGNNRSARLLAGYRFGRFSVEVSGTHYGLVLDGAFFDANQLGLLGKYSFPIGDGFELFGRGGVQHTWLSTSETGQSNAEGTGVVLGAGVEYRLQVKFVAGASIFVDYERTQTPFTQTVGGKWNSGAGMFTLGATVSL